MKMIDWLLDFNGCFNYLCISAAFLTQTVMLDDTTVKFEIWDTAGQERYLLFMRDLLIGRAINIDY